MCKVNSDNKKEERWFDFINNIGKDIAIHAKDEYDTFLEKCFKPYGINKYNAFEHKDRVYMKEENPYIEGYESVIYQRFYIDGKYAFTVVFKQKPVNEGGYISGMITTYEKVVEQDLAGISDEEAITILARLAFDSISKGKWKTLEALNRAMDALNERVQPNIVSVEEESDKHETKAPDWIYQDIPIPYSDYIDFDAIEKALGFKLFCWQKTYIAYGCFRQYGDTTARILRDLINPELMEVPIDKSKPVDNKQDAFYRRELREIKEKLDKAGVKTRKIRMPSGELI